MQGFISCKLREFILLHHWRRRSSFSKEMQCKSSACRRTLLFALLYYLIWIPQLQQKMTGVTFDFLGCVRSFGMGQVDHEFLSEFIAWKWVCQIACHGTALCSLFLRGKKKHNSAAKKLAQKLFSMVEILMRQRFNPSCLYDDDWRELKPKMPPHRILWHKGSRDTGFNRVYRVKGGQLGVRGGFYAMCTV